MKNNNQIIKMPKIYWCFIALLFSNIGFAQNIIIEGRVQDAFGNSMADVRILNDSDSIGVSDKNGHFENIAIKQESEVIFQKQGFKAYRINVDHSSEWNITLKKQENVFRHIPFGMKRKSDITSSSSFIEGSELEQFPTQNLTSSLAGMLPGLTVLNQTGDPVIGSPELYIRSLGTLNNNKPLIYIDGFEGVLDFLTPSEIESISIFKDAVSLAPFGMRGANGVVWVETKKGLNQALKVNFESKTGISQPLKTPSFLNSYDYANLYNEALSNDIGTWSPIHSDSDLEKYRTGSDEFLYPDVNWYDQTLSANAPFTENNLLFNGGNSIAKYFVSLGYRFTDKYYKERNLEEYAGLKNTGQVERYNFRSMLDIKINKIFSSKIRIAGGTIDDTAPVLDDFYNLLAQIPPNAYPVRNIDGSWAGNSIYPENPLASLSERGAKTFHQNWIQSGVMIEQDLGHFIKGLSFEESFDFSSNFIGNYDQIRTVPTFQYTEGGDSTYIQYRDQTTFDIDESERFQWSRVNFAATAKYARAFNKINMNSFVSYRQSDLKMGGEVPVFYNDLIGNLSFDFFETYFIQGVVSYSGSNNYIPENRYGVFPAVSAGIVLNENNFLKNSNWLNVIKVRASAGLTGDDSGARFADRKYYPSNSSLYFGTSGVETQATFVEGQLASPSLTFEKSLKYNFGIETGMLNHKWQTSVDVFYDERTDILGDRSGSTPSVSGAILPLENIAEASSYGLELFSSFNGRINHFQYQLGGNFSYVKSNIDYIDEIYTSDYQYRAGNPIGQIFGLESAGLFQSIEEINDPSTPIHTFAPVQPGDIRYVDQNGDGLITADDEIAIGYNNIPEITYGFNASTKWKNFDLNLVFYGVANRSVLYDGYYFYAFRNNTQAPKIAEGRWAYYPDQGIDTRADATFPRLSTLEDKNNYQPSTYWLKDGSFLRLRNIEIGYSLNKLARNIDWLGGLRVYASGFNLISFTALKEYDPEVMTGYPLSKSLMFGFKVEI